MPEVAAATPILWADAPEHEQRIGRHAVTAYRPDRPSTIRDPAPLVGGNFIGATDRGGVMIGKRMADKLGPKPRKT